MKHGTSKTSNSAALAAAYPHPGLPGRGSGLRRVFYTLPGNHYLCSRLRPVVYDRPEVH